MNFIASNQNIQNTHIEHSTAEQYAGDYAMKTEQDHIQIKVNIEDGQVSLTFQGYEGLEKEKLIFEGQNETAEGKAEGYRFESNPDSKVVLLTTYHCGKTQRYVMVHLPEKQIVAKSIHN